MYIYIYFVVCKCFHFWTTLKKCCLVKCFKRGGGSGERRARSDRVRLTESRNNMAGHPLVRDRDLRNDELKINRVPCLTKGNSHVNVHKNEGLLSPPSTELQWDKLELSLNVN